MTFKAKTARQWIKQTPSSTGITIPRCRSPIRRRSPGRLLHLYLNASTKADQPTGQWQEGWTCKASQLNPKRLWCVRLKNPQPARSVSFCAKSTDVTFKPNAPPQLDCKSTPQNDLSCQVDRRLDQMAAACCSGRPQKPALRAKTRFGRRCRCPSLDLSDCLGGPFSGVVVHNTTGRCRFADWSEPKNRFVMNVQWFADQIRLFPELMITFIWERVLFC